MTEGHTLHETRIAGRGLDPAEAFAVDPVAGTDGIATVALRGALDLAAAPVVRSHVDAAAGRRGLVLDLGEATFIDSAMLRELLRATTELARHETRVVLVAVPPAVRRLLELTQTRELFTFAADRASAARELDPAADRAPASRSASG